MTVQRSKDMDPVAIPEGFELQKIDSQTAVLVKAPEAPKADGPKPKADVKQPKVRGYGNQSEGAVR